MVLPLVRSFDIKPLALNIIHNWDALDWLMPNALSCKDLILNNNRRNLSVGRCFSLA